jgi:hypothetical protein
VAGGAGGGQIIAAISRRRQRRVVAETGLSAGAIQWAQELRKDADDARAESRSAWAEVRKVRQEALSAQREASEANHRVDEANRRMELLTHQAQSMLVYVRRLVLAIEDPSMDMERLRRLISTEGPPPVTALYSGDR